jgi:hypothetical protein
MMLLSQDTVAIHTLRVRAGMERDRTARQAERLRRDLEWSDWPHAPGESWVFVRNVHAKAPAGQVVRQVLHAAREQAYGGGDNVVRFANLSELLAALLIDLVQGTASRRWYWKRWSHLFPLPVPRAVASLLTEYIAYLSTLCALLNEKRALDSVWLALDEPGAYQVVHELARRVAFTAPTVESIQLEEERIARDPTLSALRIRSQLFARWAPLLQKLSARDARSLLAVVVIAQEDAPLMLRQAPAMAIARLNHMLRGPQGVDTSATRRRPESGVESERDIAAADIGASEISVLSRYQRVDSLPGPKPTVDDRKAATQPDQPASAGIVAGYDEHAANTALPDSKPLVADSRNSDQNVARQTVEVQRESKAVTSARLVPEPQNAVSRSFYTHEGGLLYLLNALNRKEAQHLMEAHWEQLPHGWGWLYRLGQEIALDNEDPIAAFIAEQLGFDNAAELEQLPALPAREKLLELVSRWYGRTEVWQSNLLHLEARIDYTPSHIDMHASMNAVRLPIRLAALDINPGWLPWLGRVVTFYYD